MLASAIEYRSLWPGSACLLRHHRNKTCGQVQWIGGKRTLIQGTVCAASMGLEATTEAAGAAAAAALTPEAAGTDTTAKTTRASDGFLGFDRFVRSNPRTDRFEVIGFHHIEFWCGDASNTWRRFAWGLGMRLVAKSDHSTGNKVYASYVTQSEELVFAFTAPYGPSSFSNSTSCSMPNPGFEPQKASDFFESHGLGVRAVGIRVRDARQAYETSVDNGGVGVMEPRELVDEISGERLVAAEVLLYGDVVLRYVSYEDEEFTGVFLPNYEAIVESSSSSSDGSTTDLGIRRLDHAVGNVPKLLEAVSYVAGFTGFHEFAEFTADDVGTSESGLNSLVLASNNEMVLLPMNEPVHGTKRRSQIQTYLEHNEGAGLQHLALQCDDIFSTLRGMRMRSAVGGFEFMPSPNDKYYQDMPARIGDSLTPKQVAMCKELGILVDKDDQGLLLQIFTKPVGDRPTMFLEIIQRIGCMDENEKQKGGCGGFGKGNFSALFKSIEDYEKTIDA